MTSIERYIEVPLSGLVKAEWNYKTDDAERLKKLVENIKRNGQIENLIVRELAKGKYEIVNGNHRFDALCELKQKSAVCFNLGKISLAAAKRIAIETNETKFDSDNVKLAKQIAEISKEFTVADMVISMPYSEIEISNFIKLSEFNWDQYKGSDDKKDGGDEDESGDEKWETVSLELPKSVAGLFKDQLARLKAIIKPSMKVRTVSDVIAIEALAAMVGQMSEKQLADEILGGL